MLHVLYDQHVISTQAYTTMVAEFRSLFLISREMVCVCLCLCPHTYVHACAHTQCNTPDVLFCISLLKVLKFSFIKYVMIYCDPFSGSK